MKKILAFFICIVINHSVLAQKKSNLTQELIERINYTILTGQEKLSDSLLNQFSSSQNREQNDEEIKKVELCLRGIFYAYFHHDYLLDSIYQLLPKSDNYFISHFKKFIESEYSFNNGDWAKTSNLSLDFATEEFSLDDNNYSSLFYLTSLSNVIISRDNQLQKIDSSIGYNFNEVFNNFIKLPIDSLNNGLLIKLFWASCILNTSSKESKLLKELLWKKLTILSVEDLTYFESVMSSYYLYDYSYYQSGNNLSVYDEFTKQITASNKSYFIINKWLRHLLIFGLFGDSENEKGYFNIELKYSKFKNKNSPYFAGQRLLNYGIYYGGINQSISQSYFNKFYDEHLNDSIFRKYNFMLLKYVMFEDNIYNNNSNNKFLIDFIENQHLLDNHNSKEINYLYSTTYLNQLILNRQFKKVDSLIKFDNVIRENLSDILSNSDFKFLYTYLTIQETPSFNNYIKLKFEFLNYGSKNSVSTISSTIADIIEYATYYDDIPFADSLLYTYELTAVKSIQNFDLARIQKTDLGNLLSGYYIERSFITLFNKTQNNNYLKRLVKFKLIKDNFINNIISQNHLNEKSINIIQRLLLKDDALKSYKYVTNTFDHSIDFNYFENRETEYNHLIDSLLFDSSLKYPPVIDGDTLLNNFLNSINSNAIVLLGLASRKNPEDSILSTYVLLVENDLNKIKLIQIEDSLFNTPIGNYFTTTPLPYSKKDKFKYLLNNLKKSQSIATINKSCANKNEIIVGGGSLIDQIPLNVVLTDNNLTSKIYQVSNLTTLYSSNKSKIDSTDKKQANNILCLGGVNFNTEISSLTRNLWNYLPGTLEEVNFIKDKFKDNYQVTLLNGDISTKSNFINNITTSSFKIIHLATHSFYFEFNPSKNPFTKIPISILPQRELRSAILFAQGGEFENYESIERLTKFLDKNLTLAEIMYLPLKHTKLVVLASCETNIGLPRIYEDVFGNVSLNTAFKYAGAQYVLGTRWEVSDKYSKLFFEYFYSYLKESDNVELSYHDALKSLKLAINDPYIWGAFILIK